MNDILNPIIFYPIGFVLVLFSILTICFRNLFYSLLSAIVVFLVMALLFYILGSEYNAIIQFMLYGVAIPIILGLTIMFTEPTKENKTNNNIFDFILILCVGLFISTTIWLIKTSFIINPNSFQILDQIDTVSTGIINLFGKQIYTQYIWAFEIISIILTIIIAGLTLFKKNGGHK